MLPKLSPRQHEIVMSLVAELREIGCEGREFPVKNPSPGGSLIEVEVEPFEGDWRRVFSRASLSDWESLDELGVLHFRHEVPEWDPDKTPSYYVVLLAPALHYHAHYNRSRLSRWLHERWWGLRPAVKTIAVAVITSIITAIATTLVLKVVQ